MTVEELIYLKELELTTREYLNNILAGIDGTYSEKISKYLNIKFNTSRITQQATPFTIQIFDLSEEVFRFNIGHSVTLYYTSLKDFILKYELFLKLELLG